MSIIWIFVLKGFVFEFHQILVQERNEQTEHFTFLLEMTENTESFEAGKPTRRIRMKDRKTEFMSNIFPFSSTAISSAGY